ncbi:unnamed protein product [Miscanthus lutarioriparius]|uniref:L-gulonolactone oxidase n=1 Tax=Miscanthus lutarioriparius TaxID=422564 RepID=A0A811NJC4_9POAL|nr:unnamed protein product [Miscanthus lutarioriparius]
MGTATLPSREHSSSSASIKYLMRVKQSMLLLVLATLTSVQVDGPAADRGAFANPPPDPVQCSSGGGAADWTVSSAYGMFPDRSTCRAAAAAYPASEDELVRAVAAAGAASGTKMKVATRYSHSIPPLACPGSGDGEGLVISTRRLDRVVSVDPATGHMTVESGVTLRDLVAEAAKSGLALPYAPYWWGLTVGGMLSTGAHAARSGATAAPCTRVRQGARAHRRRSGAGRRAKVSLGVLGVISQVTLALQPLFKRSVTFTERDDDDLTEQVAKFGYQHEFAAISWFPAHGRVVYRIDDRLPLTASGEGAMDFISFRATPTIAIQASRLAEDLFERAGNGSGKCLMSRGIHAALSVAGYGLQRRSGGLFTGYPVVGPQHRMEASGGCLMGPEDALLTACPWDPRVRAGTFVHQTTFSLPVHRAAAFVAEGVLEEIEQMGIFKYGGLPQWGKNRNLAFVGAARKYPGLPQFLRVKDTYDPDGLFSGDWSDMMLGIGGRSPTTDAPGCALKGMCVFSRDEHCAPEQGYV